MESRITIERFLPNLHEEKDLKIYYGFFQSPLGDIMIAKTIKGIFSLEFSDNHDVSLKNLHSNVNWYRCELMPEEMHDEVQELCDQLFLRPDNYLKRAEPIILHVYGTDFQIAVWKEILKIPYGRIFTYGDIARTIGNAGACRAVGTAVGRNPVSILIPCHRIVPASGKIGNYRWGANRKRLLLKIEGTVF